MKKLFFATAIALGTLTSVQAQDKEPMAMNQDQVETAVAQDYEELKAADLPQVVKDAVAKTYEGAVIAKAYANEKGEYKLILTSAEAASQGKAGKTVYVNSKGEFMKK